MTAAPAAHDSSERSPDQANGSENNDPSSQQQHHRRGYQACDPCRRRKVKCDLGSVDNPRPPPCVRCRRESKRCEFSATRRKRKPSEVDESMDGVLRRDKRMMVADAMGSNNDSSEDVSPFAHAESFESETRSRQKWSEAPSSVSSSQRHGSSNVNPNQPAPAPAPAATATTTATATATGPATGTASMGQFQEPRNHLYAPGYPIGERGPGTTSYGLEGGTPMMNRTAVELLSPAISNSHDALHLLSEAAGRTEDLNRQSLENRYATNRHSSMSSLAHSGTPRNGGGSFPRASRTGPMSMGNYYQSGPADAQMSGSRAQMDASGTHQDTGFVDAVKAWSRLRFVRAGWLTVEEAMDYMAHYYEHLAPLSPIVVPDYSHPSTHRTLLTDEPVLAVTLLTTASRHMKPKGDGAYTRSFYIHDRLWSYLRGMIERLFWGQEKFGGHPRAFDFATSSAKMNQKGNLRSLGTVEALLLLTDWHPRNLHFPPGDDENALLDLDAHGHSRSDRDPDIDGENMAGRSSTSTGEGRLAFHKWLEPAWRSDRMSWMLLSTAQALAFELGVFDQKSETKAASESTAEQTRKRRLRRLILVYITQSSGRLGIPSMLPLPQWTNDIQPTSMADANFGDSDIDRMHDCWIGISKIMYQSNQLLFASNEQTSELIRSGRYRDQIDRFQPFLREWRHNIDAINLAPAMRHILMIEYEYTRLYVNSLALQAVVDRWTTMSNEAAQTQNNRQGSGLPTGSSWFGVLMELYRVNEQYIQEVVDASRRILQIVLDGLVPGDHLKHTPVRSCFRILSGMIFILKTFTLGAKEDDVRVSLDLQDRVVEALRTCVVDDVHLNHAISRLLELLTTNIRTRFLRFAPSDRGADGEGSHDRPSVLPVSRQQSPSNSRREGANSAWPSSAQNNTNANNLGFVDGHNTGMATVHDPLAGIPAQPINSSNINVSFMPPPPSVYYNYYYEPHSSPATGGGDLEDPNVTMAEHTGTNALPDWFALPLDQFFNSSTTTVDQGLGGTGPMLGEFDMLEVLLNEQHDSNNGEGVNVDSSGGSAAAAATAAAGSGSLPPHLLQP